MQKSSKPVAPSSFDHSASGDVRVHDDDRVYITPGDVIADKYIVERVLGVGGIGFVVAARHAQLGGYFALKFLKQRYLRQPNVVERFTREARAACRLQSEYIARVYDVGTSDGVPFLVMEYLVGRDLAVVLAEGGRLNIDDAVEYCIHACVALASAHAHGIIHRDIKPENLFRVEHEGQASIKLLDFGISKVGVSDGGAAMSSASARLTGSHVLGTPFYMSPEQIRATAQTDARSDIWSLGVVLYELLTGNVAFPGDGVTEICAAILEREPSPIHDVRPEVEPGLVDVVTRCLQKDPAYRFRNMAELAIALLPFAPLRALAVAEGSSSIRRAAIHAIGGGADPNARLSGSMRISGSLAPLDAVVQSTRAGPSVVSGTDQPVLPWYRRSVGLVGLGMGASTAILLAAVLVRRPAAPAAPAVATVAAVAPAPPIDPAPAAARPAAVPEHWTQVEPPAPASSDIPHVSARPAALHPSYYRPAASPPKTAATAGHAAAPPRATASPVESVVAPPAPPATRSRPDVGY